jgi:hypothetical protein
MSASQKRLSQPAWDALFEALAVFYWRKRDFESFLRAHLTDYPELLSPLNFAATKRSVVGDLVDIIRGNEGKYQDLVIDLLAELSKFDERFPRLAREDDGPHLVAQAQAALADVRRVLGTYAAEAEARAQVRAEIEAEAVRAEQRRGHANLLASLREQFIELHTGSPIPQQRGKTFEVLLNQLLGMFDLEPRAAYRLEHEQVDGAFTFRTDDYLLEARWWKGPVSPSTSAILRARSGPRLKNVLGLFISVNGFTEGAQIKRSEGSPLILMDGCWTLVDDLTLSDLRR